MSGFDSLSPGDSFNTPRRTITDAFFSLVVAFGGFTHPLFTDREFVERSTPFDGQPIPGEATLLLMGALAEQAGIFDGDNVVLTAMDDVRFRRPVLVGDTIRFDLTVAEKDRSPDGRRGTVRFRSVCLNQRDEEAVEATLTLHYFFDR